MNYVVLETGFDYNIQYEYMNVTLITKDKEILNKTDLYVCLTDEELESAKNFEADLYVQFVFKKKSQIVDIIYLLTKDEHSELDDNDNIMVFDLDQSIYNYFQNLL